MADEAKTLWVKSGRKDERVALYEVDPAHPNGEVIIFGQEPHEVGDTALVQQKLHEKELVKASPPKPADEPKK